MAAFWRKSITSFNAGYLRFASTCGKTVTTPKPATIVASLFRANFSTQPNTTATEEHLPELPPPVDDLDKRLGQVVPKPKRRPPLKPNPSGWTFLEGLHYFSKYPEKYKKEVMMYNEKVVVIRDKYPKAKVHLLVVPRPAVLISALSREHVPVLQTMEAVGNGLVLQQKQFEPGLDFMIGYHAVPSMKHVHMHVISKDFNSPCLKNAKHWNSFHTDFFIPSEAYINRLEEQGKIQFDEEKYLNLLRTPLKCNHCGAEQQNMSVLKAHINQCQSSPSYST